MVKQVHYDGRMLMCERLARTFNNPEFCDVVVTDSKGDKVHCMKSALAAGSPVLCALLRGGESEIQIPDVKFEVLEEMVKFMHSGRCVVNVSNVVQLHFLADKYNVHDLLDFCVKFEKEDLEVAPDSFLMLLEECVRYDINRVKEKCFAYTITDLERILPCIPELSYNAVCALKALGYGNNQCVMGCSDCTCQLCVWLIVMWLDWEFERRRQHILPLLRDVRFDIFDPYDLAAICAFKCIEFTPELRSNVMTALIALGKATFGR